MELVADRLWLVRDGAVRPFEDDMEAYRRLLLSERGGGGALARAERAPAEKPAAPRRAPRSEIAPLQAEATRCEARVAKLEEMRTTIDERLANPLLYSRGDTETIETLQRKRAEVEQGLARAEALWLKALERVEAATGKVSG